MGGRLKKERKKMKTRMTISSSPVKVHGLGLTRFFYFVRNYNPKF